MTEAKLKELDTRLVKVERELDLAIKSLHQSIPLTVLDQVKLSDFPSYTQQQLWFFQAEITRWRNTSSRQPGFAICSFLPGVPLHPLVFLPINLVIAVLEKMSNTIYETEGAANLINDVTELRREISPRKETRLIDLPKGEEPLE